MLLTQFLSRRWLLASLLVIAALGVLIRLGFWQIDRLHQRREFNRAGDGSGRSSCPAADWGYT